MNKNKDQVVKVYGNEGRAGTKIIADGFKRKHDQIKRLVVKYKKEFEEISPLRVDITKGKTKDFNEYLLNETQFLFLGTLLRNTEQIVRFKLLLVKDFERCKKKIEATNGQKKDAVWSQVRLTGKTLRLIETGAIKDFIGYAREQGGSVIGCNRYYENFTKMMNAMLFICESKFKNLRDILTPTQLMAVGSAEQIISKSLRDDMKNNVFYKDVYKNAKKKVELFAEINGQSEVLSKQLLIDLDGSNKLSDIIDISDNEVDK